MRHPRGSDEAALANVVVIGAMKCGTSALHQYFDSHPEISMSGPKELNFFIDGASREAPHRNGTWHRGVPWYAEQFDARARVRGESSPGYTSPDHPAVADRMAAVIPDAKLVYAVRDPVDRAVSQYRHHVADSTERRPLADALLDASSQYIARGLYHERLQPFVRHFAQHQIAVVAAEDLDARRRETLRRLFGFLDVDAEFWCDAYERRWHERGAAAPDLDRGVTAHLRDVFRDDAQRLRDLTGQSFSHWQV